MKLKKKKNNKALFSFQIGEKEKRRLKAQRENKRSAWSGFGLFGMIGWSVAVPTIIGTIIGKWMDKNYPQSFSWTLTCLIIGIIIGCLIAWRWVKKEHEEMHQNSGNKK